MNLITYYNIAKRKISKIKNKTNIWVFGEWFGNRCCDNSLYLANYVINNSNKIVYWVTTQNNNTKHLDRKIIILNKDSEECLKVLNNAEAIIVNQGICDVSSDDNYIPKKALIINLWHGVPWKKIWFDAINKKNNKLILNIKSLFQIYDMFLSPSKSLNKILKNHIRKDDEIINSGYPRNSIFYLANEVNDCRKKIYESFGLDKKIRFILYLPTFRDKTESNFDFGELIENKKFIRFVEKNNIRIIQKKHYVNSNTEYITNNSNYVIDIKNEFSSQELLAASDMLITDYSSCFFDYLLLDRPIIHYIYDYDYYKNEDRGLYYSKEEVACGDCPETIDELLDVIEENLKNPNKYKELRKKRKEEYMTYESKDSCKIIYEEIIKKLNNN